MPRECEIDRIPQKNLSEFPLKFNKMKIKKRNPSTGFEIGFMVTLGLPKVSLLDDLDFAELNLLSAKDVARSISIFALADAPSIACSSNALLALKEIR